jgi:hypothetical protein
MYFTSPMVVPVVGEDEEGNVRLRDPLPELNGLLREWNIQFHHGFGIIDRRNALDPTGLSLSAVYNVSGGIGDELHSSLRALPTAPRTVVPRAKPMSILDLDQSVQVWPVLTSANTAQIYNTLFADQPPSSEGTFELMALAQRTQIINNEPQNSFLLVCGSVDFLRSLPDNSFSNDDIILNALRVMTRRRVTTDVQWRRFDNNALSMTLEEQGNWTMILLLVAPSIPALAGIAVWIRRRYS